LEQKLYEEYANGRKTLKVLAKENDRSVNWVKAKLAKAQPPKKEIKVDGYVMIADCTFFGRGYGFIIFRSVELKKNIYINSLKYESMADYQKGRMTIQKQGFKIKAIVLDGRPGVRNLFSDVPVQMCHFHQSQIIQRYLTLNPKLPASIELKAIAGTLISTNEEDFSTKLFAWHDKWGDFLKERTTDPITKRWHYTHKRTRSAFRSLKNNLPYLFTYQKYPELNIPNTTNSLDGSFSWLKQKVNIHRGMTEENRAKIIEYILNN
jgi:hypothetical protein